MSRTKNQARSAARSAAVAGRRHRRRRLLSVDEMREWATSKRLEVNPKRLTFGHLRKPDIIAKLAHLDSKPPNADKLNVKALLKVLRQVVKNKYQNFKNNRTRDSDESSIFPESGDESMATLEGEESDDESSHESEHESESVVDLDATSSPASPTVLGEDGGSELPPLDLSPILPSKPIKKRILTFATEPSVANTSVAATTFASMQSMRMSVYSDMSHRASLTSQRWRIATRGSQDYEIAELSACCCIGTVVVFDYEHISSVECNTSNLGGLFERPHGAYVVSSDPLQAPTTYLVKIASNYVAEQLPPTVLLNSKQEVLCMNEVTSKLFMSLLPSKTKQMISELQEQYVPTTTPHNEVSGISSLWGSNVSRNTMESESANSKTTNNAGVHYVDQFMGKSYLVTSIPKDPVSSLSTVLLRRFSSMQLLNLITRGYGFYAKVEDVVQSILNQCNAANRSSHKRNTSGDTVAAISKATQVMENCSVEAYNRLSQHFNHSYLTQLMLKFFNEGFCQSPSGEFTTVGTLSLVNFIFQSPYGYTLRLDQLEEALNNFQLFLEMIGGEIFSDIVTVWLAKLRSGEGKVGLFTTQYLRYVMEEKLYAAINVLRTQSQHVILDSSKIDVAFPHGVALLLKTFVNDARVTTDDQTLFERYDYRSWGGCVGCPLTIEGARIAYRVNQSSKPSNTTHGVKDKKETARLDNSPIEPRPQVNGQQHARYCVYRIAELLQQPEHCTKKPSCPLTHMTKAAFDQASNSTILGIISHIAGLTKREDRSKPMIAPSLIQRLKAAVQTRQASIGSTSAGHKESSLTPADIHHVEGQSK